MIDLVPEFDAARMCEQCITVLIDASVIDFFLFQILPNTKNHGKYNQITSMSFF